MNSVNETTAWVTSRFAKRLSTATGSMSDRSDDDQQQWIPLAKVGISVNDTGLRQSVVAVERLRTYHGHVLDLCLHLIRYRRTLDFLGINLKIDDATMAQRVAELVDRNRQWCEHVHDFGITMLATPGEDADNVTEILHLNPLDHVKIECLRTKGQPLVITSVKQPPADSWPRDIKVRCRLHYYLADRQARQFASDAIGVLLDSDGSVTETSVANIAIVRNGQVISPPSEQVLPGITQDLVQRIAANIGIQWRFETIFPAVLRSADEVILMGTDGGIWFASRVDGHEIHAAMPGEVFQILRNGFDQYVQHLAVEG